MKKFPVIVLVFLLALLVCSGCTSIKRWTYEGPGRDVWQNP